MESRQNRNVVFNACPAENYHNIFHLKIYARMRQGVKIIAEGDKFLGIKKHRGCAIGLDHKFIDLVNARNRIDIAIDFQGIQNRI